MLISKIIPQKIKNNSFYITFRNKTFSLIRKATWPIRLRIIRHKKYKNIHILEKQYDVDFGGLLLNNKLGFPKDQGNGYEPCYDMPNLFSKLRITENDTLLDVGCGKGYAIYKFSQFSFSKIVGIEINASLIDIAENNIKKLTSHPPLISFVNQNIIDFDGYDEFNYFFLYNPFPENVFKIFYSNLKKSIERKDRKVYLIYQNPQCEAVILNDNVFQRVYLGDFTAVYVNKK